MLDFSTHPYFSFAPSGLPVFSSTQGLRPGLQSFVASATFHSQLAGESHAHTQSKQDQKQKQLQNQKRRFAAGRTRASVPT
jgi:hypothetical protein